MSKIQAQTGASLADVYDVRGSIAGVEELLSKDVQLVHEMGQTIFSERLVQLVTVVSTAAIAQSASFDVEIFTAGSIPFTRVLQIIATVDTAGRVSNAAVSAEDAAAQNGVIIWKWEGAEIVNRILNGGSATNVVVLKADIAYDGLPCLLTGLTQQRSVPTLTMRGNTAAFGAGTVTIATRVLLAFPQLGGVSSKGLPLPAW